MNPKFIDVMVVRKTSFRSCFKLETHPTILLYDHIMQAFDHLSIYATKTRTKIAYEYKATRKLNKQNISFLMNKTTKEKLQQNNFSNYFTFSLTEINRTPRSLL
jgi:hypothetical protein